MCGPKFCSMKISHDIRDQAERDAGLAAQAAHFKDSGSRLYQPQTP
jgi:phosphomethylpyrimidine synthase